MKQSNESGLTKSARFKKTIRLDYLVIALCFATSQATSQTAPPNKHYELGRLFLSAEQRLQIDRAAKSGPTGLINPPKIDGVVRRSGGLTVIWLDGVPQHGLPISSKTKAGATP